MGKKWNKQWLLVIINTNIHPLMDVYFGFEMDTGSVPISLFYPSQFQIPIQANSLYSWQTGVQGQTDKLFPMIQGSFFIVIYPIIRHSFVMKIINCCRLRFSWGFWQQSKIYIIKDYKSY
jgi:hypothetical protein